MQDDMAELHKQYQAVLDQLHAEQATQLVFGPEAASASKEVCRTDVRPEAFELDPFGSIDAAIFEAEQQYQHAVRAKSQQQDRLAEAERSIAAELDTVHKYELNCQILSQKPYFTVIAVDFDKLPAGAEQRPTHYFDAVEQYSRVRVGPASFSVDKVLLNDEIEYFTAPHELAKINYRQRVCDHLSAQLSKVVAFVRRRK